MGSLFFDYHLFKWDTFISWIIFSFLNSRFSLNSLCWENGFLKSSHPKQIRLRMKKWWRWGRVGRGLLCLFRRNCGEVSLGYQMFQGFGTVILSRNICRMSTPTVETTDGNANFILLHGQVRFSSPCTITFRPLARWRRRSDFADWFYDETLLLLQSAWWGSGDIDEHHVTSLDIWHRGAPLACGARSVCCIWGLPIISDAWTPHLLPGRRDDHLGQSFLHCARWSWLPLETGMAI